MVGDTPLSVAKRYNNFSVAEYLGRVVESDSFESCPSGVLPPRLSSTTSSEGVTPRADADGEVESSTLPVPFSGGRRRAHGISRPFVLEEASPASSPGAPRKRTTDELVEPKDLKPATVRKTTSAMLNKVPIHSTSFLSPPSTPRQGSTTSAGSGRPKIGALGFFVVSYKEAEEKAIRESLSVGMSVDEIATALVFPTYCWTELVQVTFMTYPRFTSKEVLLEAILGKATARTTKTILSILAHWILLYYEEDWNTLAARQSLLEKLSNLDSILSKTDLAFVSALFRAEGQWGSVPDEFTAAYLSTKFIHGAIRVPGTLLQAEASRKNHTKKKHRQSRKAGREKLSRADSLQGISCTDSTGRLMAAMSPRTMGQSGILMQTQEEAYGLQSPPSEGETWLQWDEVVVAEQLAMLHWDLLNTVRPRELLKWIDCKNKQEECPNMYDLTKHFNRLSLWVISEICVRVRLIERVAVLEKVIKIANLSLFLQDYFGCNALINGVCHPSISRMTNTIKGLSRDTKTRLKILKGAVSMDLNAAPYRNLLRTAPSPLVVNIGIHTKDLVFLNDGNANTREKGIINMGKFYRMWETVSEVQRGLYCAYSISPKFHIRTWLFSEAPTLGEEDVYVWSKRVEPRNVEALTAEFLQGEIEMTRENEELRKKLDDAEAHAAEVEARLAAVELELRKAHAKIAALEGGPGEGSIRVVAPEGTNEAKGPVVTQSILEKFAGKSSTGLVSLVLKDKDSTTDRLAIPAFGQKRSTSIMKLPRGLCDTVTHEVGMIVSATDDDFEDEDEENEGDDDSEADAHAEADVF